MSEIEMICTMRDGEIDCTAQLLIRCKDCEFFEQYGSFAACNRRKLFNFKTTPNDFCSHAAMNHRAVS